MGRKMLYSADHFFRAAGPTMKQIAMVAAPAVSAMGPTGKIVGSGIATIGSARYTLHDPSLGPLQERKESQRSSPDGTRRSFT